MVQEYTRFRSAPRRFPARLSGRVLLPALLLAAAAAAAQTSDALNLSPSERLTQYLSGWTALDPQTAGGGIDPIDFAPAAKKPKRVPRLSEMLLRGQYADTGDMPVYYIAPEGEDQVIADTAPILSGGGYTGEYTTSDPWGEFENSYRGGYGDPNSSGAYQLQLLPEGILYPSYLAGRKEPRMQSLFNYDDGYGWIWDIALGGRVPLLRYGTADPIHPEGLQIDMEGAALLRLDIERGRQLASTDYRAGLPITYGQGKWQFKTGYYHVSSHIGDQYLIDRFRPKMHYVRDEIILGVAYRPIEDVRLYGEAGWAFNFGKTTEPWEFQFGAEYSPVFSELNKKRGTPFAAIHGHLFQERDFGGYLNVQFGWQWRNRVNGNFRLGAEFYEGCDDQFQFQYMHQRKFGLGFWYDF